MQPFGQQNISRTARITTFSRSTVMKSQGNPKLSSQFHFSLVVLTILDPAAHKSAKELTRFTECVSEKLPLHSPLFQICISMLIGVQNSTKRQHIYKLFFFHGVGTFKNLKLPRSCHGDVEETNQQCWKDRCTGIAAASLYSELRVQLSMSYYCNR